MASSKKFNELAHQSFLSLHSTYGLLMKLEERTFFNDATISFPQFLILMTVEASTPPVSQTTIAKNIHRGLNSVSMIIDRMEKQGLVVRTRSEEDRRESHITVTAQGKTALAKAIKIGGSLRERLSSSFKPEELKEAIRLLDKAKKEIERELGYSSLDEEEELTAKKQLVNLYRKGMEAPES